MNHAETMITATLILALLVLLVATDAVEPDDGARIRGSGFVADWRVGLLTDRGRPGDRPSGHLPRGERDE
ncbi:MAG TPA: hypothetical protein VG936_07680 [Lacunisphaera sp.]|nr:hypothetical protein [Lacunisphaera sp.]